MAYEKPFFSLLFCEQEYVAIQVKVMKSYTGVKNIHMEGSISEIYYH